MSINLIKIYKKLKTKDINRLKIFLESKYHVQNKIHLELYFFFKSNNKANNTEEEQFLKKNKISKANYRKLCKDHLDLIKTFIHLEYSKLNNEQNISVLSHLNIDKKILDKEIHKSRKDLEKSKTENYYSNILDDYNLSKIEINNYLNYTKIPFDKLKGKFISQNDALDSFYLWQKIKQICSYYNLKSVLKFDEELLLQEEIENLLSKPNAKFNLVIELYWNIIQIRKNTDNIKLFENLIEKFNTEEFKKLHFTDQKEVYQYVIGLCIIMIVRKNQTQFNITLFNLYNEALKNNYLTDNQNFINQRTFKNIVRCALNNKQIQWTKDILKKAPKFIKETDLDHSLAYNYGVYYYYTNDYKKALSSFSQLPYDNLFYAIDLRTYLVRLYFNLEEIDSLFSLIDSFRAFLKRNKTHSSIMVTSLRNFLNAIKKLAETNPRDIKKLKKLKENVAVLNPMVEKKWLLSIIDDRVNKLSFLDK